MLLSYVLIFLGVMLAGSLVAYLLRKLIKAAMLSWADRLAGGALGLAATAMVAALLVLPTVAYSASGNAVLRDSILAPYIAAVADVASPWMPTELGELYDARVEDLRRIWQDGWFEGRADGV